MKDSNTNEIELVSVYDNVELPEVLAIIATKFHSSGTIEREREREGIELG